MFVNDKRTWNSYFCAIFRTKDQCFSGFYVTKICLFIGFSHITAAVFYNPKKFAKAPVCRINLWKTLLNLWKTFRESVDNLWKLTEED